VANDTESQVPAPPKPQPKKAQPPPDRDAIALKTKKCGEVSKPEAIPAAIYSAQRTEASQVYSSTARH
jgi:hypothetical protein